jgi:hypothetical protein
MELQAYLYSSTESPVACYGMKILSVDSIFISIQTDLNVLYMCSKTQWHRICS